MPEDSVTVRPSLLRLWMLFALGMIPMAIDMDLMRFISGKGHFPPALVLLAFAVLISGLLARVFMTFKVSAEGIESSRSPFVTDLIRWEDIRKVGVFVPFVFYVAGRTFLGLFFFRFVVLPRFWLLKDAEAFRRALERFAPEGHVVRRVFLDGERPILREVAVLVVIAIGAFFTYYYME